MKRLMRWSLTKLTSDKRERFFALFKYTPPSYLDDRLPFEKDDEIILVSKDCPSWWSVKHTRSGKKGLVPSNHVAPLIDRDLFKWCHTEMGRDEAALLLENSKYPNGSFIIRFKRHNSETLLRLTLKCISNGITEILHYKIMRENCEFGVHCEKDNEKKLFPTLTKLVMHYARFSDGLKQNLTYSVKMEGDVFKGKLEGRSVAVKTLKIGSIMTTSQFMNEAELARNLTLDNIVRTIGVCTTMPYIVTEFIPGGDLKKYVKKNGHLLTQSNNLSIALKIAPAMTYLEENGIIHRDLAARNVLVGKTHDIIKTPYPGFGRQHLHAMLTVDKYRLPCVGCDTIMYSKMLECWSLTPADRPTFAHLNQFLQSLQN